MKTLFTTLLLTTFFALPVSAQAQTDDVRLEFGPSSKMWVTGTSSLHDWHCDVAETTGFLTVNMASGLSAVSEAEVAATVENIDCDSRKMNNKVEDALNDDNKTPGISFSLTDASLSPMADSVTVSVTGNLTIAGASRSVTFDVVGKSTANDTMTFTGSVPVLMSDHGVDPPTALLGTLKTGDKVVVHFEVVTSVPNAQ